jgi:hypothetical protein
MLDWTFLEESDILSSVGKVLNVQPKSHDIIPIWGYINDELTARGWTDLDLSEAAQLSLFMIENLRTGCRITPEIAQRLAMAFGTSAELWIGLDRWREELMRS